MTTTTTFLQRALPLAALGYRVFPLSFNSKVPVIPKWPELATADEAKLREWAKRFPRANVGIATGHGLQVIDEDRPKGGDASDLKLEPTLMVITWSGGYHHYFRVNPDQEIRNSASKLGLNIDTRGDGGFVVGPGSVVNGKPYAWHTAVMDPCSVEWLPALPARIILALRAPEKVNSQPIVRNTTADTDAASFWLEKALARSHNGVGDDMGFWLAVQLLVEHRNGASVDVRGTLLQYATQATLNPTDPFDEDSVDRWIESAERNSRIVASGERAKSQTPRTAPVKMSARQKAQAEQPPVDGANAKQIRPAPLLDAEHRTDMGNARRLVARHGQNLRYVAAWRSWLIWDGTRWKVDDTQQVIELAKDTIRALWPEVERIEDSDERKKAAKFAHESESKKRLLDMVTLAQSEPELAATAGAFDADPWVLNVLNGTIDLRTGERRNHRREDMLSKLAPVVYDPKAQLDLWDEFIETVTDGNEDTQAFLRRSIGYTLTGDVGEEKLFLSHGPTRTGKSTFLRAVKSMLGDYAITADFETFLARPSNGSPRDDLAGFAGARMVVSIEVDDGKRLAEGLVKTVTGGEPIYARHLYQKGFEYMPQFKLWLAANHTPQVDAGDDAMWARVLRVPFEHSLVGQEKPGVKATLSNPAIAGPAILAWAIQGCIEWQANGLGVTQEISGATQEYRDSMDPLRDFLADCCDLGTEDEHFTTVVRLRQVYEDWCKASGVRWPLGAKKFNEALIRHGCQSAVRRFGEKATRGWAGIKIVATTV